MDIDTGLLRRTALFHGMEDGDIRRLLDCLHCPVRRYGRGEFLWHAGDAVPMAGIVLSGCVDAVQYGEDGGAVLTVRQEKGGVFGDLLMAAGQASPLSLVASAEGAEVLFLPLAFCPTAGGAAPATSRCGGTCWRRRPASSGSCGSGWSI